MIDKIKKADSNSVMVAVLLLLAGLYGGSPVRAETTRTEPASDARAASECESGSPSPCRSATADRESTGAGENESDDAAARSGTRINKLHLCIGSDQSRSVRVQALCLGRSTVMLAAL